MPLVAQVDNTQAIIAVQRGYSKKLKFLERTHRFSIGFLSELVDNGDLLVKYAPTATHRGDAFTKALVPAKFIRAREMTGMVSTGTSS